MEVRRLQCRQLGAADCLLRLWPAQARRQGHFVRWRGCPSLAARWAPSACVHGRTSRLAPLLSDS